ncbi:MAG: hypothetical protein JO249_00420 [Acidobacteria bacterium]|nr:hypothetical protein [Acidobacteriota bacterium]
MGCAIQMTTIPDLPDEAYIVWSSRGRKFFTEYHAMGSGGEVAFTGKLIAISCLWQCLPSSSGSG